MQDRPLEKRQFIFRWKSGGGYGVGLWYHCVGVPDFDDYRQICRVYRLLEWRRRSWPAEKVQVEASVFLTSAEQFWVPVLIRTYSASRVVRYAPETHTIFRRWVSVLTWTYWRLQADRPSHEHDGIEEMGIYNDHRVVDRSCCFFPFSVSEASKRCSLDTHCQLERGSIYFLRSSVVGAPEESRFLELHSHYQLCRLPNLLLALYLVYLWRMVYIFVIYHWWLCMYELVSRLTLSVGNAVR